jgi:uncharacterized protein YkwD
MLKLPFYTSLAFASITLAASGLAIAADTKPSGTHAFISDPLNSAFIARSPFKIAQSSQSPDIGSLEAAVHTQINNHRASLGLPALTRNATIDGQARIHSQNMANGTVPFSHNGFQQRVQTIAQTIPLRAAAENVSYNQGHSDPVSVAVQGWLNSSGHRANIEDNYNLTGIGIARSSNGAYYFTQMFIRQR